MDEEVTSSNGVLSAKRTSSADEPNVSSAGETAAPVPGYLRSALIAFGLAAAFAFIPRMTRSCEGLSTDEVAPDFKARIVANGQNVGPVAPSASGSAPSSAPPEASTGRPPTTLELSSLRGRPVILDFWATWCQPCQAEAPIVNTIANRYKDRGLAVVGVNTSDEDGLAAQFVRRRGLSFPVVYDENNAIAKQYGVANLPTLIVVSKTGKIVAIRHGVTTDAALDDIVRRYL